MSVPSPDQVLLSPRALFRYKGFASVSFLLDFKIDRISNSRFICLLARRFRECNIVGKLAAFCYLQ